MAEQRLIDANALEFEYDPIDGIMNKVLILGGRNVGKTKHIVKTALKQMIDNAPTIDAVEVVRCKDCKSWVQDDDVGYCDNPDGLDNYAKPNDFCSYGERKEREKRKNNKGSAAGGGIGFVGLLTIVFIVLKLCGVIAWPWGWVLSPLWITAALVVVLIVLAIVISGD